MRVVGDDTGLVPLYLHRGPGAVTLSSHLGALLDEPRIGSAPAVAPRGVSHLLHHALVPLPETIFRDVYFLGIGDRADLDVHEGEIRIRFSNDYPYLTERSKGDGKPDPRVLLAHLTVAVTRQLGARGDGFLMLSSGKDSSAVALALAEAGRAGFPCVTFRDDEGDEEYRHARALCRRLGLCHEVVDLPLVPERIEAILTEFWSRSPLPCGDFAQIAYAICVATIGAPGGAVLDGSGNDAYMGYLPGRGERLQWRFALGSGVLSRFLAARLPPDSGWNYFLRSRAASTLPGRTLRPVDTRRFYPGSVDTGPAWQRIGDEWAHLDLIGFRNSPVEHHVDQAEIALKIRLAAESGGREVALPYCDRELIDYVFHLPESSRFDRRTFTNKLLLREMLERYAGYDSRARGQHFFPFAGDRFLLRHRAFALDEIRRCRLWDARIGPWAETWFRRMERRPLLYHALLPLFMLSGWHNHSRYAGA